jgi:hypothetical protein
MKEFFQGLNVVDEEERHDLFMCALKLARAAIICGLVVGGVMYAAKLRAEPILRATEGGAVVTLHNTPCELTHVVENLPYKATWEEKGKTFQGCYGPRPDIGAVLMYFDDKTVALAPLQAFQRVVGI